MVDKNPSVSLKTEDAVVVGLINSIYVNQQLRKDVERLGAEYKSITWKEVDKLKEMNVTHFFVEHELFTDNIKRIIEEKPEMLGVLMVDFRADIEYNINNIKLRRCEYILV